MKTLNRLISKMRLNRRIESSANDFRYSNQNLIVSVRDIMINDNGHKSSELSKVILDEQDTVSVTVNTKFQIRNNSNSYDSSNKYRVSIIYFKNKRMFQSLSNFYFVIV